MKWLNCYRMRLVLVGFVAAIVLGDVELAKGATIVVGPGASYDFDSIQAGIDITDGGDTVLVAPGEYVITEPLSFRGKAITVISEAGQDETTIRMGTPADPNRGTVVVFENNETVESVLDGFTITGGRGVWFPSENVWVAGGIAFDASSGTVRDCAIVQNSADDGGGIGSAYECSPKLIDCTISGNLATTGVGGGVLSYQNSSMSLTNCAIMNNTSQHEGGGIGCLNGSVTVTNCVIARNTVGSPYFGGGLGCAFPGSSMTIINCTIWGNEAPSGGGVACWQGSATVTNSILWGNTASKGREIWMSNAGTVSISYSNVAGGQAEAIIEGDTVNWGEGNIDADPLFAEPGYWADVNDPNIIVEPDDPNAMWIDGDYHLKSEAGRWDPNSESWVVDDVTSPCIDWGDPNSPVGDEPDPNGGLINMGAYGGTAEASMSIGQLAWLLAHWKLDEAEGEIAYDSARENDAIVLGEAIWQPNGGQVDGTLQLDGIDDYLAAPFILDPTKQPFSVYAWIKGGQPGQTIVSQQGAFGDWLSVDSAGAPATGLTFPLPALMSDVVITDDRWHHIGLVSDGSDLSLYVDDIEVTRSNTSPILPASGDLQIGAGKNLEPGTFWSGLIDDVRIYDRVLAP